MKAMVVRAPGGTEVLQMETIADPVAGPKDVVIKVDACGVCFHDIVTRNGTLKAGVQMRVTMSWKHTPQASTLMTTSFGPGVGSAIVSILRTSVPPGARTTIAFMQGSSA